MSSCPSDLAKIAKLEALADAQVTTIINLAKQRDHFKHKAESRTCEWQAAGGYHNPEYASECGLIYQAGCEQEFNFCPNCGGKLECLVVIAEEQANE